LKAGLARRRAGCTIVAALAFSALTAATAEAHAILSPTVVESKKLQQFTLSVPTEKEKLKTTKVELDISPGFAIDSWEPEPGWKRTVQAKGSGEEAVVQKVVWSGGSVPTEEDAVFRFNASAPKNKTYKFTVRQTYSDGSVVDWNGPESSDTPAPTVKAVSDLGSGSSSDTLSVIALIVAALALLLAGIGLLGGRRSLT
jgi:uncharacterized protein YcnI